MAILPFWVYAALHLYFAAAALAQATTTSTSPSTTTSATPSCTASPIATICDYPSPGSEFAVASDGRASCWNYCNAHQPCDFVIFVAGNPNTGTGTCWLYPGKTFDAKAGSTDCRNPSMFVYGKPECAGGTPTSSGDCAATASPSAIAEVCGYPTPGDCFYGCYASGSASNCLSLCAKADSCSYAVFNPRTESLSPHSSGTCWVYPNGTYNAQSATPCKGKPEQYVYNNVCPKPSSSSSSSSSAPSSPATSPAGTGVAGAAGSQQTGGQQNANSNSAPGSFLPYSSFAIGMTVLIWHGLR
ncbi:hypothetical protein DM02DRAFT_612116 [Periconia macrospinosa]|uniref:Apple domain-containing protein n=1 Tax=Periconia macrospinosa TaxID=97972 RepID=A0A2V1E2S1_9PLEO|nr:hypothetical protein DM02DRAFT_612116 [Periconia macrospinosa]